MNFYNYLLTKVSLRNGLYRKFSLNCKQHSKTRKELNLRKEFNLIKCLFNSVLTISLYCKDMVELSYIKDVQKQPFADLLQNKCFKQFCKIHRITAMLESLLNNVAHVVSYDLCGIFKSTYFLITPQNQTTLLRKQISKAT